MENDEPFNVATATALLPLNLRMSGIIVIIKHVIVLLKTCGSR